MLNDDHTLGMADLLVKVAMPSTIFISLMRPFSVMLLAEAFATLFITGAVYLLGGAMGLLLARIMHATDGERHAWTFGLVLGNVGFMGIPLTLAVFGYEGLIYASMANASFNIIAFTIGVRIYAKDPPRGRAVMLQVVRTPALIATFVGLLFFVTGLRLPSALENGVSLISGMTTPISLVLVGASVARRPLKEMLTDIRFLPAVALRLLVLPIVTLLVLRLWVPELMLGVIVTLVAMPAAAATVIFAEQHQGDTTSAAKFVVVSTLLCIITVPLLSLLL